ncbi:MAG TPA: hypothetical protein VIM19_12335 [Actinomycetes bacterium]
MILNRLRAFGAFWYDFIIGDDWRVALGVAAALAATYLPSHNSSLATWWIVPVAVMALLPLSLRRAIRNRG